ncbi:MAG: septal ring lytic transglycosylase RlpA family protein [Proteobacteria bacterium]|nr:septal ring lytic transglycosylase RlpA family protein [Pseudomonadota bacterium]
MPYQTRSGQISSAINSSGRGIAMVVAAVILLSTGTATADLYDKVGEASWYGKRYHGRTTANGESFDMNALTAAHRRLPFGTLVRVTNLSNKRSLVVRINDRGPYAGGRIIDLSKRAAALLGFEQLGVVKVRVQTVQPARKKQKTLGKQRRHSAHSEESIRNSLARSPDFQPVTLRPPSGVYR